MIREDLPADRNQLIDLWNFTCRLALHLDRQARENPDPAQASNKRYQAGLAKRIWIRITDALGDNAGARSA